MIRALVGVAVLAVLAPRVARADECREPAKDAKIDSPVGPELSVAELTAWVLGVATCKNIILGFDAKTFREARALIIAPKKMTPKQAVQLYVDSVESLGFVVVQKQDTIIVKRGPSIAKCPDVAALVPSSPSSRGAPTPSSPTPADDFAAAVDAGVRAIDDTHVQITVDLLDRIMSNPMDAGKAARLVPALKDGKPSGWKLYAIRPRSIFARLNFANGDTIAAINGTVVTNAENALDAYTKLRDAKRIVVDIERRGKPMQLTIDVVAK
jgi:hypothetical protein